MFVFPGESQNGANIHEKTVQKQSKLWLVVGMIFQTHRKAVNPKTNFAGFRGIPRDSAGFRRLADFGGFWRILMDFGGLLWIFVNFVQFWLVLSDF